MAAAAITGGNPFRTMMLTWRYTLPAFLVPFDFVLSPHGEALLLEVPAGDGLLAVAVAAVAVALTVYLLALRRRGLGVLGWGAAPARGDRHPAAGRRHRWS